MSAAASSAWADTFVGIPFVSKGRTMAGADCWGLACLVYRARAGIELPTYEVDAYDPRAIAAAIGGEESAGVWTTVAQGEEQPLDIAIMRSMHRSGFAAEFHVGIVVRPGLLLHVEDRAAAVCLPFEHETVRGRIKRLKRHRRLAT